MKELITPSQLSDYIDTTWYNINSTQANDIRALFKTLYNHGFRISELQHLHEWEDLGDGTILCHTLKGSSDRIVSITQLQPLVLQSIADGTNYVFTRSNSTYERIFNEHKPVLGFYVNNKQIACHLFRHNLIKTRSKAGWSPSSIASLYGLKNVSVANQYIDSEIYAETV